MTFTSSTYENFVSTSSTSQSRLFPQYKGYRNDFEIVVVGSGVGGGILADDLADRLGTQKRILVLEAGSYLFPTHVFNICRFPNADVADKFECNTFWQWGDSGSQNYIHERPQLNFGGRSIFWSGLIPTIQPWELEFFPPRVRHDLTTGLLARAGEKMNESASMGTTAQAVVTKLRQCPLAQDFEIQETPRALHQPYLTREGVPADRYFVEPTGVFNTAELLINQAGLTPGLSHGDGPGLHLLLNHYVEDIKDAPGNRFELVTRNTLDGQARTFQAGTVVLAGGSIESPKLLRRSSLFHSLPDHVKPLVGLGLTDHPTTDWIATFATNISDVPIPKDSHAKIVFYSRGRRDSQNRILYPFNVEMNINHEYWHLRENDPSASATPINNSGASIVEIKFSFANCLDNGNEIKPAAPYGYVPEIAFKNLNWMDHLAASRFPALAGWQKSYDEIFAVLNEITYQIFSQFQHYGSQSRPENEIWYGQNNKDFGLGTVHHAVGSLRMPHRAWYDGPIQFESVVDEDLRVLGTQHLYVCDMSVIPFSSAANPVRTLVALALRLSEHFG
jgi:choline dehydrogenase-like flavoprotein